LVEDPNITLIKAALYQEPNKKGARVSLFIIFTFKKKLSKFKKDDPT
jgi:hypothetical protein